VTVDQEHLGWVAALIEGEGWIGLRGTSRPVVQVVSTDLDVVERLREWTGVGVINANALRPDRKQSWRWTVGRRDDAGMLLEEILPLLLRRRAAKARGAIEAWRSSPPKRGTAPTCTHGHDLSGANVQIREGRRRCRACGTDRMRKYRALSPGA
jgi:hypothetical protein